MSEKRSKYNVTKYNARKTEVDGYVFDSAAESRRYRELKVLERIGEIKNLVLQPAFKCVVNGVHICIYYADFQYCRVMTGETMIEDVKGVRTPIYQLKKKLVEAIHGITISETSA